MPQLKTELQPPPSCSATSEQDDNDLRFGTAFFFPTTDEALNSKCHTVSHWLIHGRNMMGQNHHKRKETTMKSDGRYCQFKLTILTHVRKKCVKRQG